MVEHFAFHATKRQIRLAAKQDNMVYDVFTYNGERETLDIRLHILNEYVDGFIIVEANKTFSGKDKQLYFKEQREYFAEFLPKIKYYIVDDWDDNALWEMAKNSPNTNGAEHWKTEFYIKESIKKALTHLKDDDLVFIGDVDEIWDHGLHHQYASKEAMYRGCYDYPQAVFKLALLVYPYYLNNLSSERFWGTSVTRYANIKDACLNHLRTKGQLTGSGSDIGGRGHSYFGWHFTSQGGIEEVRRKLNDSYTAESYNTQEVQDKLEERFGEKDYIGRGFTFKKDEKHLPQYLIDNKEKYAHLWK